MCFECSAIVSNLLHSRPMLHDAGTSFTNCYVDDKMMTSHLEPLRHQHLYLPWHLTAPHDALRVVSPPPFFLSACFSHLILHEVILDDPFLQSAGLRSRSIAPASPGNTHLLQRHLSLTPTYLHPPPHLKTLLPSGFYVYCWMWCTWKAFVWVRDKMSKKPPLKCSNTVHGRIFILRFLKLFVSYRGVWFKAKRVLEL